MRDILFRGKNCKGEWIYGNYVYFPNNNKYCGIKENSEYQFMCCCDKNTIGQYTGFTDKNGTKIFEGDIFVDKEDEVTSVVEFRNGMFCLVDYGIRGALMPYGYDESAGGFGECDCQPMDNYYIDKMEIDGNIYDNKELLKGENKDEQRN